MVVRVKLMVAGACRTECYMLVCCEAESLWLYPLYPTSLVLGLLARIYKNISTFIDSVARGGGGQCSYTPKPVGVYFVFKLQQQVQVCPRCFKDLQLILSSPHRCWSCIRFSYLLLRSPHHSSKYHRCPLPAPSNSLV